MLPGIKIHELNKFPDERGFFCELLRGDWEELLEEDKFVQANMSLIYPEIVRAWHGHARGQVDYFALLQGAIKICASDDSPNSETRGELTEIVASSEKLQIVLMPGRYWHGFKALGTEPAPLVYFVTRLYDHKSPDEERRQGLKVACLEEVAYRMGCIDAEQVRKLAERYNGDYRKYLQNIASESHDSTQV